MMNVMAWFEPAMRLSPMRGEVERLLNLIGSRLRRQETVLAEEFAEELLEKTMDLLLHEKAARMGRMNRLLLFVMKLLLSVVCLSLLFMVMNIAPYFGLKIFIGGYIMIALVAAVNHYLSKRFYRAVCTMIDVYKKESRRFTALLIDCVRGNGNPETALNMFCLAVMQ